MEVYITKPISCLVFKIKKVRTICLHLRYELDVEFSPQEINKITIMNDDVEYKRTPTTEMVYVIDSNLKCKVVSTKTLQEDFEKFTFYNEEKHSWKDCNLFNGASKIIDYLKKHGFITGESNVIQSPMET